MHKLSHHENQSRRPYVSSRNYCLSVFSDSICRWTPPDVDIKNFRVIADGVAGGGHVQPEQIAQIAADGYSMIVNLLPESESQPIGCAAEAEKAGMQYIRIPVSGTSLTRAQADALKAAFVEHQDGGHVLLHCRSGNRVGALWALYRAGQEKISNAKALEIEKAAGMRSPATIKLLQVALEEN